MSMHPEPHDVQPHDVHLHNFLRPDHWDVADIWVANWDSSQPPMNHVAKYDWVFHHLEALHEDGAATICALNKRTGGIAGFITVNAARGCLLRIAVASTARGAGVASALLDRAKLLSHGRLHASVPNDNARALRFFAREGFLSQTAQQTGADGGSVICWRHAQS